MRTEATLQFSVGKPIQARPLASAHRGWKRRGSIAVAAQATGHLFGEALSWEIPRLDILFLPTEP